MSKVSWTVINGAHFSGLDSELGLLTFHTVMELKTGMGIAADAKTFRHLAQLANQTAEALEKRAQVPLRTKEENDDDER